MQQAGYPEDKKQKQTNKQKTEYGWARRQLQRYRAMLPSGKCYTSMVHGKPKGTVKEALAEMNGKKSEW